MRRRLDTDHHDPAWTDLVRRQKNAGNMWREVSNAIGAGTHDHDTAQPPLACRQSVCYILNHMVQYSPARFDASFAALSDATRRGVLEQLGRAHASITD